MKPKTYLNHMTNMEKAYPLANTLVKQRIILTLAQNGGSMLNSKLAESINITSAGLCRCLNRLEKDGYIKKEKLISDYKQIKVSLSDTFKL